MKTFMIILFSLFVTTIIMGIHLAVDHDSVSIPAPDSPAKTTTAPEQRITLEDLLDAIEQVESGGDANAVGDSGRAVGAYQIWKIYVDDCNRIHNKFCASFFPKHPFYTYSDRRSKEKSRGMVALYTTYYWERTKTDIMGRFEFMARIHNGGPNGWKKESTKEFWDKVKAVLYE